MIFADPPALALSQSGPIISAGSITTEMMTEFSMALLERLSSVLD